MTDQQTEEMALGFAIALDHDAQGRLLTIIRPATAPDDEREPGAALMIMLDLDHPDCYAHWATVAQMVNPLVLDHVGAAMAEYTQAAMAAFSEEEAAAAVVAVDEALRRQGMEPPDAAALAREGA